jgi:aminopeptidase N
LTKNSDKESKKNILNEGKIILPLKFLKIGKNKVSINFVNLYRRGGHGLHSFIDPEDKNQYVYTKFEPAYCRYVFPVFDQPDLRASWILQAVYPSDWIIISNEYEISNAYTHDEEHFFYN